MNLKEFPERIIGEFKIIIDLSLVEGGFSQIQSHIAISYGGIYI